MNIVSNKRFSQWKLTIVDKPLIEGKIEHLGPIMDAFYIYSNLLIKNEIPIYESKLIDIKAEDLYIHKIVLKSSKTNVKPLILKIGNSLFTLSLCISNQGYQKLKNFLFDF